MVFQKMKLPDEPEDCYGQDVVIHYVSDSSESSTDDEDDSPTLDGDFTEYLWMENIEEFDKQVLRQLEEEELMEQCIEAMLEENDTALIEHEAPSACQIPSSCDSSLIIRVDSLSISDDLAKDSKLNPEATEFVPRQHEASPVVAIKA